ncbi:MAG TPA: histidine kinase [Noviherbaspirillum sp.]|jgi:signal transduction histidine kinase|uniref:sensor histidine kinase n=1 Tax=Noviherbaspirillum sp. TaxID=1926288 RepID=UPI002F926189
MNTGTTDTLPQAAARPLPRLRRFAIDVALTQVFNIAVALVVTYILRLNDSFVQNLVVSVCIGTMMVSFIDGGRLLLWGQDKPPALPFALLFIAALPSAQLLGNAAASLLLGIPLERLEAVRSKNEIGFYLMFILVCASITWFFWKRSQIEQLKAEAAAEKARAAATERQALQAQLQLLQAQIEPHMLFNTLANLQGLIAVDPQRAQLMLDQLIQYLRATLGTSRAQQATLGQEFALMEAYLGLMQVRMGSRLSFALRLPPELAAQPVPPMLLQPLVENAIKHGLEPKLDGGRLDIDAQRVAGGLVLTVRDDGLGHDENAPTAGTRTGLANVRERLRALYGPQASLDLEPATPHGVRAIMRLPV